MEIEDESEEDTVGGDARAETETFAPVQGTTHRGEPWFESMVEDSRIGKLTRKRGGHTSTDGRVQYEWEVVEMTTPDELASSSAKRKLGETEEGDDTHMRT